MDDTPPNHRILLRGPWSVRLLPLPDEAAGEAVYKVHLPGEGRLAQGLQGTETVYSRSFHAPLNPLSEEQVWIVFPGVGEAGTASLNSELLGALEPTEANPMAARNEFRIDGRLRPFNQVEVRLLPSRSGDFRGLYGAAYLEFRPG